MVRYNLLVITDNGNFSHQVLKAVGKSFKKHLLFEAENQLEAIQLMERLHVDMIVCDLDAHRVKLDEFAKRYPNVQLVGVCNSISSMNVAPGNALVLARSSFQAELALEFKEIKKAAKPQQSTSRLQSWFGAPASFDNYSALVGA